MRYVRINAIKEEWGALGCLKSHHKCMKYAESYKNTYDWFLILEDDSLLNLNTYSIQKIIEELNKVDKLYLNETPAIMLHASINGPQPTFHDKFKNVRIANGACNTTNAYIIKTSYANVLKSEWDKSIPLFYQDIEKVKNKITVEDNVAYTSFNKYNADNHPWVDLQQRDQWFLLDNLIIQNNASGYESTIQKSIEPFKKKYNL